MCINVGYSQNRLGGVLNSRRQIIGKHIDQVEELGDVGAVNMDRICRIVSKHRRLNEENVRLFYDITNRSLVIYDSTSACASNLLQSITSQFN
jgi:hypothetical protein